MYEASLATLATLRNDQAVSREQDSALDSALGSNYLADGSANSALGSALDSALNFRCRQRVTSRAELLAEFLSDGSGGPTPGQAVHENSLATLRHEPAFLSACEASCDGSVAAAYEEVWRLSQAAQPLPSQEIHRHLRHAPDPPPPPPCEPAPGMGPWV